LIAILAVALLLLTLGACTQSATGPLASLNATSTADLQTATALAAAMGDVNGVACWQFLATLLPPLAPPATIGAATAVEITRLSQQQTVVGKCAAVVQLPGLPPLPALIGMLP
jgi:hypothetical protein